MSRPALPAALLAFAITGCAAGEKVHTAYADAQSATLGAVGLAPKPEPVTQVLCFWQQRLGTLSNPVSDGEQVAGVVGQMFFIGPRTPSAEVAGDVVVSMTDITAGAPGTGGRAEEVYHFDRATVAKLKTKDDRFGECHAFFLPWPKEWGTSVKQVRLVAAYFPADGAGIKIEAPETKLTIDFAAPGTPTWSKVGGAPGATGPLQALDGRGVRDPRKVLSQIKAEGVTAPLTNAVLPASAVAAPAAPSAGSVPPPTLRLPPGASPTSGVGAYLPASNEPVPPKNLSNARYATDGAWAGPAPATRPELGPDAPVVAGPAQAMILPRRN